MMMDHLHDNVRPLICPQIVRTRRRHRGVAPIIRLRPRARRNQTVPIIVFALLSLAVTTLLITTLALVVRSGHDVLGGLAPGGPWW
jgi:hypothetical protein